MILNKKTCVASLSGFQYGYNTSIMAAAVLFLKTAFSLTPLEEGLVFSSVLISALFTSFFAGVLANNLGRKGSLVLGVGLFLIGTALSTFAAHYPLLLIGRFIVGIASSIALTVAPIYLVEVSPAEKRGAYANLNQIGIAFGAVLAYYIGYLLSDGGNWRLMIGLGLVPGFTQLIGLFFISESPYQTQMTDSGDFKASWKTLASASYRSRLFLGLAVCAFQSLIGAPTVFYFAPMLFEKAGIGASNSLLMTIFIGIVYALGILASFWAIDRLGRRPLMLISSLGMTLSLGLICLFFYVKADWLYFVMAPSLLFFILCYSLGIGPVPPLVVSEITPTHLRGTMVAISSFFGMIANSLVTLTCPVLLTNFSLGGLFTLYTALGLVGFGIFLRKLPETKGTSFAEVAKLFS